MANEWQRVVNTTIKDYVHGFEQEVLRRRILLDRIKKAGNIEYNASGTDFTWNVKKSQRTLQVNNGTQIFTFAPTNVQKQASLTYQGYAMGERITKRERLMNRGTPAIVKIFEGLIDDMFEDADSRFAEEIYVDSAATGNAGRISGVNTIYSTPTQTYDTTTTTATTAHTANAADPTGVPLATYGGLSTVPGNEGGTWTGRWPDIGYGDAEFDYFSPLVINYTSTYFDGSSTTWANNCVAALRYGLTFSQRNIASEGMCDLVIMASNLFRQFKDKKDANERVVINQGSKDREYGIKGDIFYQDGAEITHEAGVPAAEAYGYNIDKVFLLSMQGKLWEAEGPIPNIESRDWRIIVDFLGQMKFKSPRNFVKWMKLA
jgi:hypothetical protein